MGDLAHRFTENPLLQPSDIQPGFPGMEVECLLNPGAFCFQGKTWLLLRVAERPRQKTGKTSFPVLGEKGEMKILEFDNNDPDLDLSDPRVISYAGKDYLTTMSHLRLVSSEDGGDSQSQRVERLCAARASLRLSASKTAGWQKSATCTT